MSAFAQSSRNEFPKEVQYLPVKTSLAAKLDLKAVKSIDFVKRILLDDSIKLTETTSYIETIFGLDLMKVDTTWMAVGGDNEFILLMDGGFDSLAVENALRKLSRYSQVNIDGVNYIATFPDENKPGINNLIAILDDNTVLFGEEKFATEYLKVFTRRARGIKGSQIMKLKKIQKSNKLFHGTTINFVLPEKEKNNPILKNLSDGEFHANLEDNFLKIHIDAEAKEKDSLYGMTMLLNGILNMQKQGNKTTGNKLIDELIYNSVVKNDKEKIYFDTKVKKQNIELLVETKVFGLDAVFQ
ncbi:MAG: hypothetical protein NE330_03480 [Lentisphaeraceae bacterium]|nr:hypothetical protein [Lentisphaeraceae bacterium]